MYRKKQQEVLHSGVHLVEIDLLRTGNHVLAIPEWAVREKGPYDYLVSINRATGRRTEYEFFARRLRDRLPKIPVPLAENDREVPLDIRAALEKAYETGALHRPHRLPRALPAAARGRGSSLGGSVDPGDARQWPDPSLTRPRRSSASCPRQVEGTVAAALAQRLPGRSWGEVRRLLQSRRVMLSGNLCTDAGRRLRLADVVKLLPQPAAPPARGEDVRIRYLDKHVVVAEKPAGMTTTRHADERQLSPRQRQLQPTLDELLPQLITQAERTGRSASRQTSRRPANCNPKRQRGRAVRPVHRLDRETSGLLVFARTAQAQTHLEQQFRKHTVKRRYLAVVRGAVAARPSAAGWSATAATAGGGARTWPGRANWP